MQIKVIDPNSVALITRARYKAGKQKLEIFGERFQAAARVLIDGVQVTAKYPENTFVIKRLPLATGSHQIVIVNPDSLPSQTYILTVE